MNRLIAQTLKLPWNNTSQEITGFDNLKFTELGDLVSTPILNVVFAAAGIGLLLMLISSGFTFLTSAGDAKKLESGRQRLTYAIAGFLIIFVSYWLVQMLGIIFGFDDIQSIFK